jgi:NADPH-dependent curcumin reductase CurA
MLDKTNRFWRLDARPQGSEFADALTLAAAPLHDPGEGEIVIHNRLLSMDAGTRMSARSARGAITAWSIRCWRARSSSILRMPTCAIIWARWG